MAGLQSVIDNTGFITINQRKSAGSTISRSGHLKTSVQQGAVYRFTVGAPQGLKYSTNRLLLSQLDSLDVTVSSNVDIGGTNTNIDYITSTLGGIVYAGGTSGNISVNSYSGNVLYIDCTNVVDDGSTILKAGDFIQPRGNTNTYKYPYQLTQDLSTTSASNVAVYLNRPVIEQTGVTLASNGVRLGRDCRFHLTCVVNPTYSVVPHDLLEFSGDFELMETIT